MRQRRRGEPEAGKKSLRGDGRRGKDMEAGKTERRAGLGGWGPCAREGEGKRGEQGEGRQEEKEGVLGRQTAEHKDGQTDGGR